MGEHTVKLPDVGEGVAEAELVEWHVEVGKVVREDDVLAVVMTDKAAVEIPSPVAGTVRWMGAGAGDTIAVGSPILRIEVDGDGNAAAEPDTTPEPAPETMPAEPGDGAAAPAEPAKPKAAAPAAARTAPPMPVAGTAGRREGDRPVAAPAVRRRAKEAGVDLRLLRGSGPAGRITHEDLDARLAGAGQPGSAAGRAADTSVREVKVIGLRRRIAERMSLATSRIAHITYVEEIDMTELERLRESLNAERGDGRTRLTILPFLMLAMVRAIRRQPMMNAHFDDDAGVIRQYGGMHIGVAAQTPSGLVVPVVRHVEARGLWDCAAEVARLAALARDGGAGREELTGSTITITSLGALGGIVSTPVINHPEVAIVGVNKLQVRPMWDGHAFQPRKMMNLSSSFDHRVIDGWDAATFIQAIKRQLESPASIFIED